MRRGRAGLWGRLTVLFLNTCPVTFSACWPHVPQHRWRGAHSLRLPDSLPVLGAGSQGPAWGIHLLGLSFVQTQLALPWARAGDLQGCPWDQERCPERELCCRGEKAHSSVRHGTASHFTAQKLRPREVKTSLTRQGGAQALTVGSRPMHLAASHLSVYVVIKPCFECKI